MMSSWASSAAAGTTLLFCLLLAGCSLPREFTGEIPALTDRSNTKVAAPEPTRWVEKNASAASKPVSSPVPAEALPSDSSIARFATSLPPQPPPPPASPASPTVPGDTPQTVWGILDMRGFPVAQVVASNGVEYNPLFLLDLDFNIMLWREQRVYLFGDASFWGQKPGAGVTNPSQGSFDFSKREFDFNLGAAWNYSGPWEARLFAYSFNNLNRGDSQTSPSGFNDGVGLENRYYLGETYAHLGTTAFDEAKATFLSVGYYPTKTMVDGAGNQFKPGPFARAYLTCDLWSEQYYLYGDVTFIASRSFQATLLNWDAGLAARPFAAFPRLEFRLGTQDMLDLKGGDLETGVYVGIRYVF